MKKLFLILIISLALISCGKKETKVGDGKLIVWGFFEGMPKKALDDWAKLTGKKVEYQTIAWADYQTKLNTVVGTSDAPDIVLLEKSFMGQYLPTNSFLNIGEIWKDTDEVKNYLKNTDKAVLGQSKINGQLKAIGWENTSGAFFYRTDLAKKYLNVNSPEQMEKLISTKDDFLKLIKKFNKEFPKIKFLSRNALSTVELVLGGAYNFSDDGSYVITKNLQRAFKNIKDYYNMNYFYTPIYDKTPILNGAKNDKFFAILEPAWAVQDVMEWDQSGKWSIANPPYKWNAGGTFIAVTTNADKDLAWDFLSKTFLNEDWILNNMAGFGMVANSKIMTDYMNKGHNENNEYFSGENTIKKFSEISKSVNIIIPATPYDSGLETILKDIVNGLTSDNTIPDESTAAKKLKKGLNLLYPDLKITIE